MKAYKGKGDLFYFNTTKGIPEWCPAKKEEKNDERN